MEQDKKVLLKILGKHIQNIRKEKGITQKELALEIGKDTQAIERLERGGTNPTFYFLYQVAKGLNVPIEKIIQIEQ